MCTSVKVSCLFRLGKIEAVATGFWSIVVSGIIYLVNLFCWVEGLQQQNISDEVALASWKNELAATQRLNLIKSDYNIDIFLGTLLKL